MTQWTPSDLQSWEMTKKMLKEDGETGAKFLVFVNFWLNTAEKMMVEHDTVGAFTEARLSPTDALRKALEVAEQRLGFVDVYFLGQLLACVSTYWQHGDECCRGMSAIELKLTGEGLRIKLDDMGVQAANEPDNQPLRSGPAGGQQATAERRQESIDPLDEPDRRASDSGAVAVPDPRGQPGRTSAPGPEERGPHAVRNRLGERPPGKGGRALDRRPSRPTLRGE